MLSLRFNFSDPICRFPMRVDILYEWHSILCIYFCALLFFFFSFNFFGDSTQLAGSQFLYQGWNLLPLRWKRRVLTIGP